MRKASVWAFSALFGCISLFGSGWHLLVGHEFHATPHGAAACHRHEHGCESPHDRDGENPHVPAATHSDHCPICKFLAQAQWAGDFEPEEFECAACGALCHAERAVYVACIGLYHSRAPPLRVA